MLDWHAYAFRRTMPTDCYRVEVLHFLNPHLIWVEVRDSAIRSFDEHGIVFEQIGIYGLLPLETTIDLDDEEITVQSCKEWQPASTTLMRKFFADEEETLFTPIFSDRRSSIFDDNIHRFGDLVIKKKNGKTKSLSQLLSNSGFASCNDSLFHRYLIEGKINTKLNKIETQNVLTELEKYFINKNVPKKKWEKPINKQTSVARISNELEEALTKTNLDKHNKSLKVILDSKNKDFELCKGVDEPSVGRATIRKVKEKTKSTPVEKKLELLQFYKTKADSIDIESAVDTDTQETRTDQHLQAFEETKMYLEGNSSDYSKKILSKTDAQKAQILKKVMSKTAIKKNSKQERLVHRLISESKEKAKAAEEVKKQTADLFSSSSQPTYYGFHYNIPKTEETRQVNKTDEPVFSSSNQDQNVLDKININEKAIAQAESTGEMSMKTEQIDQFTHSSNDDCNLVTSKGTAVKEMVKTNVTSTLQHPFIRTAHTRSISSQQKVAYSSQSTNQDQDSQNSRRVREITNSCTSKPVTESMVKKLMNSLKINGSHSDIIENAIRKSKDGVKSKSEAVMTLMHCRTKTNEGKKPDESKSVTNASLGLPLSRTVAKTKLKRRGKKYTLVSARNKTAFGPPGIDINSLTRVPPVYLYGEEISSDEQNAEDISNRLNSVTGVDSTASSKSVKNNVPSCSNENKPVTENVRMQEIEIKKQQRNEKKVTSMSCSSVWERRLKIHKKMAKTSKGAPHTSDTSNKDSSYTDENNSSMNIIEQNSDEDSNESISDIIDKLAIENNICNRSTAFVNKDDKISASHTHQQVAIKANPFQNFDLNNSVFVENLVTPIMMVHSKTNEPFVPVCNFRDIHFSDHIRLVLKNLRIERPMMIQSITWNAVLRGHSVFMIGSASSGKTIGYLPAVCRLVTDFNQSDAYCDSVGPFCIIVCATSNSVSEVEKYAKMLVSCNEKVVSCYYGHDELAVATSLLNGCDILICTAPSLVRLLQMPDFGVDLQRLATFVLDDCERLSEVYLTELKFCLYMIKKMLKSRVNKEMLVQYVVASRNWCDFMEKFAKKAPDTVICIGAFQECVLYAKANMKVSYVKKEDKLNHLIDFLLDIDPSKRTVIVCDSDEEVDYLSKTIQSAKCFVFAANSKMTVQDLYLLSMLWKEFGEPLMAPILICCDANLYHMNIVNANYLVQYSMPSLYSTFCRRFATLNESYPSMFRTDNQHIKILMLLEENNVEQFPKIINFVKRCTDDVPGFLDIVCESVLAKMDVKRAENYAPLCNTLMALGYCPDLYNCKCRHTILKEYDEPKHWMPKSGTVTFKILHYHNAALYSARLIGNTDVGTNTKYPPTYSSLSLKMGIHYSNKKNRILFGVPKVGDICAVALGNNLFSRSQVIKIIDKYENGSPKNVLINLIDEEIIDITTDINLYHLPNEFKDLNTYVVHVRLANIQPTDRDVVFSELARDQVKTACSDLKKGMYMEGKIVLTVGNCIFVETLEVCQSLKSLNETVVMCDVKRELLEKHAEINPDHISGIETLCMRAGVVMNPTDDNVTDIEPSVKVSPKRSWAHLLEDLSLVDFGTVETPDIFFVRLTKFDECMKILITDIQRYIIDNAAKVEELIKDDIVLAEYPDDGMYERARIDDIGDEKVKCFFVDQGEWRYLNKDKFLRISETLITQLPFQAIECRLVGIKAPKGQWSDDSTNWLFDKCSETEKGARKKLFVKYFTKEPAQFTGGHKYGVVLIDTYGNEDLILNQLMIDLDLADEVEDELKFLYLVKIKSEQQIKCNDEEDDDDFSEELSKYLTNSDDTQNAEPPTLLPQPIRSMPLVGSDDESDDSQKWNVYMTNDMAKMLKSLVENSSQDTEPELPAVENNETEILEEYSHSQSTDPEDPPIQHAKINLDSPKELDSNDLLPPETCTAATNTLEKAAGEEMPLDKSQLRKPKLSWRQTRTTVTIKIQLVGVETYDLRAQDRNLTFTATANDTDYGFDLNLYGVIYKNSVIHSNKGQYILVKLNKVMHTNWLNLTRDVRVEKWIVYDVDSIDTSSDEEEVLGDNLHNIVESIHNKVDSDSDDDFVDDVGYRRRNND